jgi:uncharacterized protein (DUF433 family)
MAVLEANSKRKRSEPSAPGTGSWGTPVISVTRSNRNRRLIQEPHGEEVKWEDVMSLGNELGILTCILVLNALRIMIHGLLRVTLILRGWVEPRTLEYEQKEAEGRDWRGEYGKSGRCASCDEKGVRVVEVELPGLRRDIWRRRGGIRLRGRRKKRKRETSKTAERDAPDSGMNDSIYLSLPAFQFSATQGPLNTTGTSTQDSTPPVNTPPESIPERQFPVDTNTKMNDKILPVQRIVMPAPGTHGTPFFRGENITMFLEDWDYACEDYQIEGSAKHTRMLRYVDLMLRDQIRAMPEYEALKDDRTKEGEFYTALKALYRDNDWESLRISRIFLESVVRQAEKHQITTKKFLEQFHQISTALANKKQLENLERCELLLKGLPQLVWKKVMKSNKIDVDDMTTFKYDAMFKTAWAECQFEEKTRRYQATRDPEVVQTRKDYLDRTVHEIMQPSQEEYSLPRPPPTTVTSTTQNSCEPSSSFTTRDPETLPLNASKPTAKPKTSDVATLADLDILAKGFEKLSISTVSLDKFEKSLQDQTTAMGNLIQQTLNAQATSSGYQGYGTGRGGFSAGRGRGGFGGQRRYSQYQGDTGYMNPDPTQSGGIVDVSAAYGAVPTRTCYACHGRLFDGSYDPNCDHTHSDRCPEMMELQKRGCIHKEGGRWCLGAWSPDRPSLDLNLRNDAPWLRQIHMRIKGTEWDFDTKARAANKEAQQNQVRIAIEGRNQPVIDDGSGSAPESSNNTTMQGNLAVLKRPQITPSVTRPYLSVQNIVAQLDDGREIDDFYEEWDSSNALSVYAVGQGSKAKTGLTQSARGTFRRRAAAEEKLPQAKSQRPTGYIPQSSIDAPGDMDLDELADGDEEEIIRPDLQGSSQDTLVDEEPARKLPKSTAPLPRMLKGRKMVADCLKTPNPVATLHTQWLRDNQPYLEVLNMAKEIAASMAQHTKSFAELARIMGNATLLEPAETTQQGPTVIGANAATLTFDKLVANKWVVTTPKVHVNLLGPVTVYNDRIMLDSGAECNILPLETARRMGCTITSIDDLHLTSVSGQSLTFAGISKIRVELEDGFGCDTVFFLLETAPKVLLGQPFISRMRMTFEHHNDGSWDGVFVDPDDSTSTRRVMVVPPLRKPKTTRVGKRTYIEDVTDEELETGN